jgi:hypothetical protein
MIFLKTLFLIIAVTLNVSAFIPPTAFKDITKHFVDPHYSPLMGLVALDSGLIYNLRHFGKFTPAYEELPDGKQGRRLYDRDIPQDGTMALLLNLFPSAQGPLTTLSSAVSNYGKMVDSPETVADLLRFTKEIRKVISES